MDNLEKMALAQEMHRKRLQALREQIETASGGHAAVPLPIVRELLKICSEENTAQGKILKQVREIGDLMSRASREISRLKSENQSIKREIQRLSREQGEDWKQG